MTAGSAIAILSALLSIVRAFANWLANKQLLEAGAAQAVLKGIQDADAAIATANKARDDARDRAVRDPAGVLRDDDGFRRPD